MKTNFYSSNTMRFIVLLLLLLSGAGQSASAQCGSVSSYVPTVSATTMCSGNQLYVYATGLPVSNWIYRDNNTGSWNVFNYNTDNATQYISVSTPTIRTYRAVVSTFSCPTDTTVGVTVSLVPATYGNNNAIKISASATQVCSGSQVTLRMMNQGVQPTAWIYRENNGPWYVYTNTNAQTLTIGMPVVTSMTTREYRVLVKNSNNCTQDSSASIQLTITPAIVGNNPNIVPTSSNTTICGGATVILQLNWPLEVGNWIYKDAGTTTWQSFTSGSTSAYDYNTNVLVSGMREYRAILKNPGACLADTSGAYFVMINASQRRVLSSIQPRLNVTNTQVCAGNSMSFQITGYSNIQSWIYRDSATGNWTHFSSSSSPSLSSTSTLTKDLNREVRVVINNSATTCSFDTSASVFYTVKALTKGTSLSIPFTTSAELCVGAQPTIYLQNGQTVTTWLYRNNNTGSWTNSSSSGNTYTDYNTSNFTVNTTRAYRAIINNTVTCRTDSTPEVQVLYKMAIPGGVIGITPIVNQPSYCSGASYISGNINLSNNRQVTKWIYRDNNTGVWNELANSSSTYFYDYSTTVASPTIRSYKALVRTLETFSIDTSLEVVVTINPVARGTVGVAPTSVFATVCNDNSITLNIVPLTGYSVNNWVYRDTVSTSWTNYGSTSTSISNYISTTYQQRMFRVVLLNSTICKYDTTNTLAIAVVKKSARNNTAYMPTTTTSSICGGSSLSLSISLPSGTSVYRWVYRDNGSVWKEIFSTSTNYFESTSNTRVLIPTVREYKVIVNDNNNCFTDTSAAVVVNISPLSNGAASGITPTVTSSVICAGSSSNTVNFTYSGSVQKWVYRDNGASWQEFSSNTASTYLYDNNMYLPSVTNREYRAYIVRSNTCLIDTTQIVNVQIRPMSYGNAGAIQPTASVSSVCSGSSFYTAINSGAGYNVHKWIYRTGLSGDWSELTSSSASTTYYEYNTAVNVNTQNTYRAIIQTNTCSYDTTQQVGVQLIARTNGYANAITLTSSTGVYCASATVSANVISTTMPSGSSVLSWMYKDNMMGGWVSIPNTASSFLSHTGTAVSVPTSRSYRVVVNNSNGCSYDSSNVFSVSINPSGIGYASTITPSISSTNICNASTNPTLSVGLPSGYTIVKWVVNNNGTGWTDFGYATNSTSISDYNVAVQQPVSRSYRAIVRNSNFCSIDSTNTVSASINPAVRGVLNSVTPTSTRVNYCYTKSIQVNVSIPSGYAIEKWIYNDNNTTWNDFVNSTTSSFLTDNNTYVSSVTSRSYRVIMLNNSTCQRDTTAGLAVVINPRTSSTGLRAIMPTANPATGICAGSNVTLSVVPGTGNELLKWTYSDNGSTGPWYDALGSYNSTSFTHQLTQVNTAKARLYRAIITDTSSCDLDSTQSVVVNITPVTNGIDTSISITGADSVCIGTSVSLSVVPGSGNSVTKWIYRDNNGAWNNFVSSTQSSFLTDANTLLAPGSARGYSPLIYKTNVCRIDTLTKVKTVVFKNKTFGNSLTSTFISVDTVCAGSGFNASTSGSVERWLYRDGKVGVWNLIQNNSTSLYHTETGVLVSGWRYYRAILNTGSCNADTTKADSVFLKIQSTGNNASVPTTANATVCASNSVSISVSVSGATMQRWIYRDNGVGNWNVLSVTSNFSVVDYNTSVTSATSRAYRAIVLRTCSYDTTGILTVTITPKTAGTDNTKIPTATSTSVCASNPIQNIQVSAGSGNTIMQWLSKTNNGAWQVFSSGNQNNLTDYNTYVGSVTTRSYVAIINNNTTCKFDTSAVLAVTINPVVLGNSTRTVTAPATGCMGSNYSVSHAVASDSTVIRFLSNYNGGVWSDEGYISPTTNASISRYAYNGSTYTMGYRAITYKASNCHIDTTTASFVSIVPRTNGNDNGITPSGSSSVCSGSSFTVSVSPGSGNSLSHWVYSDDGINWTPYYTSSTSFNQSVSTGTPIARQFRALVLKGANCSIDTTASTTININPFVYGNDGVAQVNITSGVSACIGTSINVNVAPGSGNSVNTWLYADNGSNWNNFYTANTNLVDYNTFVSTNTDRVYAAIIWKQSSCALDTTLLTDTVLISTRTYGNDSTITILPSTSSTCIGSAVTLTCVVGSHTVQTWYYQDNGGAWNVLSNSTSNFIIDYNTGVSIPTTRLYRALIRKSNICAFDTSASVSVTITPRSVGVDIGITPTANNVNTCSGNIVTVSVTPGSGNSIQKWIYRQNGGAWMDFSYTSATSVSDYNTSVGSAITREYKAIIVKGSGCAIDTSNGILVNISPIGFGNQSSVVPSATKTAICSGSAVTLSVSGFSGSSVLRWLYRDNNAGAWNIVYSSATSITDFNTQTATAMSRQYRAIVNNNGGCSTDTTASVSVSINPITNGTDATLTQVSQPTVCTGNSVNAFINPAVGKSVSSWLYKDAGSNWTLFATTSLTSINDFNTTVTSNTTRQYRAILTNAAGCSLDSSAAVSVNINVITTGTNLAITPSTPIPNICSGTIASISVSGFSGTVVKWLYRDSVVDNWNTINSATFTLFHSSTFVSYPRTRTYRAIIYNANNCSNDTTAAVQLQINPQLAGNANAIVPTTNVLSACTGSSVNLSATGFINGGAVTAWMYADDGGNWVVINAAIGASVNHAINVNGPISRQYRALVFTGCQSDTTAAVTITLDKFPTKPTVSNPSATDSLICAENAHTYEWRLNGNIIPGATNKVHVATVSGIYSVQVGNVAGCKTVSDNLNHGMVGLADVFANTKVSVYPNPTTDGNVSIEWEGMSIPKATMVVMDMLGRVVITEEVTIASQSGTNINLADYRSGIYFITLSAEGNSITRKVLYQK